MVEVRSGQPVIICAGAALLSVILIRHWNMVEKSIFRVVFHSQGNVYELYAREVSQGVMYAFVEVGDIIFGERSKLVVDPSEEKLKSEFSEVKRTYIPLHAVIRIDEVEKEGKAKITPTDGEKIGNISPFPMPLKPPAVD